MSLSYDILNIFFFKLLYIKIRVTKQTSFKCKVFVRLTPCVENSRRCFCVINQADCSMNSTLCILMSSNVIGFSVSQFRLMSLSYTKGLIMYKWMWFVDQKWSVGNLDFLVPIHFHYHIQFTLSYNSLVNDNILCNCTRQDILKFMLWGWNVKSY